MNIIDFANPFGFWWVLIALPIIALFILKVRLRRVPVTTLLFWNQLFDEKKPRSWWQQLRHWLSLLLQLAFLLLLVGAVVDPLWSWQRNRQKRLVLVLDNSASMQAIGQNRQSRLERAKEIALGLLGSMRDRDEIALVAAGGRPQVIAGVTNQGRWVAKSIKGLQPTDGPSALAQSVDLARRLIAGREGDNEIVVLTDGCSGDLESMIDDKSVRLIGVGEPQDNLGITRFQVRRSLLDAIGYQVLVDVTNHSDHSTSCRLELDLEDLLVDVLPLELQPNETVTRLVNHTSAKGGRLIAKLNAIDALSIDNSALAILPTVKKIPVHLVTEGNLFIASVLQAMSLIDLKVTVEYSPESSNGQSILIFDRKIPSVIPTGRVLIVDPQGDCDLWNARELIEQPIVAAVDQDSPITQHVRLDNVLFPGAKQLEFQTKIQPLIREPSDIPLMARIPRRGGDVVVLNCNLERGDLPLRIAFPVLMKNTIEWFQGDTGELRPIASSGDVVAVNLDRSFGPKKLDQVSTAESIEAEIELVQTDPSKSTVSYELLGPDGKSTPIASAGGSANIGPLMKTGLWIVRPTQARTGAQAASDGRSSKPSRDAFSASQGDQEYQLDGDGALFIACNLSSKEESDLRPKTQLASVGQLSAMRFFGSSLWFYLTLIALILITIEWWLYQRRIVG